MGDTPIRKLTRAGPRRRSPRVLLFLLLLLLILIPFSSGGAAIHAVVVQGPKVTTIPPAGPTGTSITLSGAGLAPSTAYIALVPTSSRPAGLQIAGFNTTSNGLIPSYVTAIIPVIPTCTLLPRTTYPACTSPASNPSIGELGSGIPINLFDTVTSSIDASGTFLPQARMTTNVTVASTGHPIVVTATGLYSKSVYLVIFGAATTNGNTQGIPVGGLETTANGTSSGTFIIPNTSNNQKYVVQLYRTQFKLGTNYPFELANPPTLVGGSVPSRCTISTSTLVPGIPSQSGRHNGVEIQYTNTQACTVT